MMQAAPNQNTKVEQKQKL